jgi:hypothetical protein
VTTALPDACHALTTWLPHAHALTTRPDVDGTTGHGTGFHSQPPWNTAAANAYLDAAETTRRLEASLRHAVTGHPGTRRGGTDANTLLALQAIENLGQAVTSKAATTAARILARCLAPIERLPAVDTAEPSQKVRGATCPYCHTRMLLVFPRSGRVTCLLWGACFDGDGNHPAGLVDRSVTGEVMVAWADGHCQYATLDAP